MRALPASAANEDGDGIIEAGENETDELAGAVQNPVASLISLPFQNKTNFNFGPLEKVQQVLNIQPVWPFELNKDCTRQISKLERMTDHHLNSRTLFRKRQISTDNQTLYP